MTQHLSKIRLNIILPITYCLSPWSMLHAGRSVGQIAAGPRLHSQFRFRVPSGHMTISLFFPRLLCVLKWGLLFDERRGLTTTGHSPSTGDDSSGHRNSTSLHALRYHQLLYKKFWEELPNFLSLHIQCFIRHRPHKKHRVQQLFYCCVCIRCRGNVFIEPLPSNGRLLWLHNSGFQALGGGTQTARWSHKPNFIFSK
jgi:hypothetical protein